MNIDFFDHDHCHLLGKSATSPIGLRYGALAALLALQAAASQSSAPSTRPSLHRILGAAGLSLAGMSPQRRHPCRAQSGQSPAFFMPSKPAPAGLEPRHSALPAHRIAAHSGSSNCRF